MTLGNVHIWVVPLCYVVDLPIPRNRVFGFETFNMGSAVLEGGRSPDIQEFCFHVAKRSDMYCGEMQWGLFDDSH